MRNVSCEDSCRPNPRIASKLSERDPRPRISLTDQIAKIDTWVSLLCDLRTFSAAIELGQRPSQEDDAPEHAVLAEAFPRDRTLRQRKREIGISS